MREIVFDVEAWDDLQFWVSTDIKKIFQLINNTLRTFFEGIGKPEPLKGNFKNCWSRRINNSDRVIYRVSDTLLVIFSLLGHYD